MTHVFIREGSNVKFFGHMRHTEGMGICIWFAVLHYTIDINHDDFIMPRAGHISIFWPLYLPSNHWIGPLQFNNIDDWVLRSHHLEIVQNILTAKQCVDLCMDTPACASVDYKALEKGCYMNEVGRFWTDWVLQEPGETTHIEIFPSLLGKPCGAASNHVCSERLYRRITCMRVYVSSISIYFYPKTCWY